MRGELELLDQLHQRPLSKAIREMDRVKELGCRRARRAGHPLSVVLCDIDRFKRYNGTYGHTLGGEEFAVLLPGGTARDGERGHGQRRARPPRGEL